MKQEFYSNGKLLLTGEYVVLDGAKALALPTKKGQSLRVSTNTSKIMTWQSFDCHNKIWYATKIDISLLLEKHAPKRNSKFDATLFTILWHAQQLNPNFLHPNLGYAVETHLTFERLWGLGTSSTLINNIATWAEVNPFELLNLSFGGSGYDIACAKTNSPILYQKTKDKNSPIITSVVFNPIFKDKIFFIYLNEKKDSKEAISSYKKLEKTQLQSTISAINSLTEKIANCTNFNEFEEYLKKHEMLLSSLLKVPTIQQQRFSDFKGVVKSLGGWGGDFVMATGSVAKMNYFKQKGYTTIIPFQEMIL